MKKTIFTVLIILFFLVTGGVIVVYAKDAPVFDIFFSEKVKEERDFNRLEKLYPEKIGNYTLYYAGGEKVAKKAECSQIDESFNDQAPRVQGELCTRQTIGQYRMDGSNKTVFVYIYKETKGGDLLKNYLVKFILDKLGNYNIIRMEKAEIGWIPIRDYDYILTQESMVVPGINGGESFNYANKATGDNPVTQYFLLKYPSADFSQEQLKLSCADSDNGEVYDVQGSTNGNYYDPIKKETRKEKIKDVCTGDVSFTLQDSSDYIKAGILTQEQTNNKNILLETYCSNGFIKISTYECLEGCSAGACIN